MSPATPNTSSPTPSSSSSAPLYRRRASRAREVEAACSALSESIQAGDAAWFERVVGQLRGVLQEQQQELEMDFQISSRIQNQGFQVPAPPSFDSRPQEEAKDPFSHPAFHGGGGEAAWEAALQKLESVLRAGEEEVEAAEGEEDLDSPDDAELARRLEEYLSRFEESTGTSAPQSSAQSGERVRAGAARKLESDDSAQPGRLIVGSGEVLSTSHARGSAFDSDRVEPEWAKALRILENAVPELLREPWELSPGFSEEKVQRPEAATTAATAKAAKATAAPSTTTNATTATATKATTNTKAPTTAATANTANTTKAPTTNASRPNEDDLAADRLEQLLSRSGLTGEERTKQKVRMGRYAELLREAENLSEIGPGGSVPVRFSELPPRQSKAQATTAATTTSAATTTTATTSTAAAAAAAQASPSPASSSTSSTSFSPPKPPSPSPSPSPSSNVGSGPGPADASAPSPSSSPERKQKKKEDVNDPLKEAVGRGHLRASMPTLDEEPPIDDEAVLKREDFVWSEHDFNGGEKENRRVLKRFTKEFKQLAAETPEGLRNAKLLTKALDLALACVKCYELDKADAIYRRCLQECRRRGMPWDVKCLQDMATLRCKQHRQADAAELLEELARIAPPHPATFINLGTVYNQLRQYDKAESWFLQAVNLKGGIPGREDHWNLGIAKKNQGKYQEALPMLESALKEFQEHEPDQPVTIAKLHSSVGGCLHDMRRYREAAEQYQQAYDIYLATVGKRSPLFAGAAEGLMKAKKAQGHWEEAFEALLESFAVHATCDSIHTTPLFEHLEVALELQESQPDIELGRLAPHLEAALENLEKRGLADDGNAGLVLSRAGKALSRSSPPDVEKAIAFLERGRGLIQRAHDEGLANLQHEVVEADLLLKKLRAVQQ